MAGLNVRNLISRFEELTTGFERTEPKTPLTPKTPILGNRQFFPETKYVQNNSSNVKLLKIEQQIIALKKQVRIIEEVSNDDFVRILFSLLNLLIDLAAIEVEGNVNVKQRKNQCFKEIIGCKDDLVGCLDEDFAIQNGIVSTNTQDRVQYNSSLEVEEEDNSEEESNNEEKIEVRYKEPQLVGGVSKLANIFESKSKDTDGIPKPNIKDYFEQSKVNNEEEINYFEENNNLEKRSPKSSTDSDNSCDTIIYREKEGVSDETVFESNAEIKLSSVKKLRDMFEAKSTEELSKSRSTTKLNKLIQELENDDDEKIQQETNNTTENSLIIPDDKEIKSDVSLDKQKALMDTLLAELDYYKSLISSMDPDDEVRAEVLEENLVEMFIEINKFETCGDHLLQTQKQDAINLAQELQTKINEKKTNIGNYFNDLQEGERRHSQLPPAGDFEAILIEVERYKDLVSKFNPIEDKANGAFLEENICEVLLLLDNYQPDDDDERNKKMRAIKDLGLILNDLTMKKETKDEKHLIAVCPQSPHKDQNELITDENFKNYIAVCPPAPENYMDQNKLITDENLKNYIAVCPPAPDNYRNTDVKITQEESFKNLEKEGLDYKHPEGDYLLTYQDMKGLESEESTEKEGEEESLSYKDAEDEDLNLDKEFDDLVKETNDVVEVASARLKDICAEVNIFKSILKELQIFDEEELEIFKRNVAELEDVLINLQCGGDVELELRRKETIKAVREIQDGLEKFKH